LSNVCWFSGIIFKTGHNCPVYFLRVWYNEYKFNPPAGGQKSKWKMTNENVKMLRDKKIS